MEPKLWLLVNGEYIILFSVQKLLFMVVNVLHLASSQACYIRCLETVSNT